MAANQRDERAARKAKFEKVRLPEFKKEARERAKSQILIALDRINIPLEARRQLVRDFFEIAKAGEDALKRKRILKEELSRLDGPDPRKFKATKYNHNTWTAARNKIADVLNPYWRLEIISRRDARILRDALLADLERGSPPKLNIPANNNPILEMPLEQVFGCPGPKRATAKGNSEPVKDSAQRIMTKWTAIKEAEDDLCPPSQGLLEAYNENAAFADPKKLKGKKKEG